MRKTIDAATVIDWGGERGREPMDADALAAREAARAEFEREGLRAAIRSAFEARVARGLPVAGHEGAAALDPGSRGELGNAVLMAMAGAWPEAGFWRLSDNAALVLTGPQVTALGVAAGGHYQALFAARSTLLDAAAAGQVVDPEAGWPTAEPFDPGCLTPVARA